MEEHLATSLVLNKLGQNDGLHVDWTSFRTLEDGDFSSHPLLCFTQNGDSFLLGQKDEDRYYLQRFYKPGEEIEAFWVTYDEMTMGLGVLPQALSITKKQNPSALAQPFLPPPSKDADLDANSSKEHYVIHHFRRQSRTALSIIGISVVIALLGVITPLGFQTFTDKILPYQAQSSLMVIAILLLVAAMMTALFNYYHDYQESVLFAKYQSGLGKEVFNRLLAMAVPYFDSQQNPVAFVTWSNIIEATKDKLVNQDGQMQWDDWNSGDLLLFNDFVAPFGHTREILKDLRSLEWPNKIAFSLRRAQDGSVKKVNYWWHQKDYKQKDLAQRRQGLQISV
jgi:hypothetical protein